MKVVNKIKKGIKSIGKEAKRAVKSDAVRLFTGETALKTIGDVILPPLPDMPGPTATQGTPTVDPGPSVDLASTEGTRRTSGVARGSRKLRVPLGGLRR